MRTSPKWIPAVGLTYNEHGRPVFSKDFMRPIGLEGTTVGFMTQDPNEPDPQEFVSKISKEDVDKDTKSKLNEIVQVFIEEKSLKYALRRVKNEYSDIYSKWIRPKLRLNEFRDLVITMIGAERWNSLVAEGAFKRRLRVSDEDLKYWISVFKLLGSPSLTYKFLKDVGQKVPRSFENFRVLFKDLMTTPKYKQYLLTGRYTIKDMQIMADLMGRLYTGYPGECLSSEIRNIEQPLLWKCGRCGFEHYQSFKSIRDNNFQSICLDCFFKIYILEGYPQYKKNWDLLDRYNEICEKIFLPHFNKKEFFEASLGILKPLISVFNAIFESGIESKTIINGFTRNAPASDRIIQYTLLKAKEALFNKVIKDWQYDELLDAISTYAPYIVKFYQNDDFVNYYKRHEPVFERWLTHVPLNLITSNPNVYNKYHSSFSNPDVIRTQREILYLEWGGRDLVTGKLFKDTVNEERGKQGLPDLTGNELYKAALLLIDRHHYQILQIVWGKITFMKRDCRLQALMPLTDASHGKIRGNPREWERKFREAKEAVLKGKLYIPPWWDVKDRIAFAQYLRKEGWRPFSYY